MTLLGLGIIGWILSLAAGFALGGVLFMSMKLQVDYVLGRGQDAPLWLMPTLMFVRLAFVAAVLLGAALWVPKATVGGVLVGGLVGAFLARVVIGRWVRRLEDERNASSEGERDE